MEGKEKWCSEKNQAKDICDLCRFKCRKCPEFPNSLVNRACR